MNIRYPIYEGVYRILTFEKTCTCFVKNTYVFPKKDVRVFLKAK